MFGNKREEKKERKGVCVWGVGGGGGGGAASMKEQI